MLRSVKYGLYGAVLAGVVGGTVAWTNVDKTVHLVVDGRPQTVHTSAGSVGGVLTAAGFHPGAHDIVAPSVKSTAKDGATIVFKHGRLLRLSVDGKPRAVWTTAATVAQALDQLGYSSSDQVSVSRSRRLPLAPTDIAVRTPRTVTLSYDGTNRTLSTTDVTVAQLLDDLGLTLGADDKVSIPPTAELQDGDHIVLTRVVHKILTETRSIPFKTTSHKTSKLPDGKVKVTKPGVKGTARITYAAVYVNGKLVGKTKIDDKLVTPPTNQVQTVGSKLAPDAPSPSPGTAQGIARQLLKAHGWGSDQYDCLVTLWNHESGWRVEASNSGSGAYGIPQALPGSKMASAGPDWQTNAETQIKWGLNYIESRYDTPCGAWSTWQAHGGWY